MTQLSRSAFAGLLVAMMFAITPMALGDSESHDANGALGIDPKHAPSDVRFDYGRSLDDRSVDRREPLVSLLLSLFGSGRYR